MPEEILESNSPEITPEMPPAVAFAPAPAVPDTTPLPEAPLPEAPPVVEATPEVAPPPDPTAEPETPAERVVPEADGYKLPEGIPPELGKFANTHDFTQEQLDATLQQFGKVVQGQEQARLDALKVMGEAHLKNWGENADHNITLAKRALQQNDTDGSLAKALNESGYGNHPAVLNFLYTLGKGMQEGGYLKSAVHKPPGEKSLAQAMYGDNHPSVE